MSDLTDGIKAIVKHSDDYEIAEDYYTGEIDEVFASDRLRRLIGRDGTRYRVNLAKTAVDEVTELLEVAAISVPDEKTATATLVDRVWNANKLYRRIDDLFRRAGEYGDAYLLIWDGEQPGTVDVLYNSPKCMRVVYDPENPQIALYAIKQWRDTTGLQRATLYYPDRIERHVSKKKATKPSIVEADWQPYGPDVTNPYGQIPVFHFRNEEPYGQPEHHSAYGPQDAVNKLIITLMSTVDFHGAPQRYLLADPSVDSGDDAADWPLDDTQAVPTIGGIDDMAAQRGDDSGSGTHSKLRSGAGQVWWLENIRSAGQFSAADPDVFLTPLQMFIRLMAQTTKTPLHYFDPSGDQPSGESLKTANEPLYRKGGKRRLMYGETLGEALTFSLGVLGVKVPTVDVRWAPMHPNDDLDTWQVTAAKQAAGVPTRQVLIEAGYTAEEVDGWLTSSDGEDLRRKVELVNSLAMAAQQLGAAITLGAVSQPQVETLMAKLLGEDVPEAAA